MGCFGRPTHGRHEVTTEAFDYIQYDKDRFDLVKKHAPWPGDYDADPDGEDMSGFMQRMKFSSTDYTQMLSSSVLWWVYPKFAEVGWKPEQFPIPLLNTYPDID